MANALARERSRDVWSYVTSKGLDVDVGKLFLEAAARHGDAVALASETGPLFSYAELATRVRARAGELEKEHADGTRVVLVDDHGADFWVHLLGAFAAGIEAVCLRDGMSVPDEELLRAESPAAGVAMYTATSGTSGEAKISGISSRKLAASASTRNFFLTDLVDGQAVVCGHLSAGHSFAPHIFMATMWAGGCWVLAPPAGPGPFEFVARGLANVVPFACGTMFDRLASGAATLGDGGDEQQRVLLMGNGLSPHAYSWLPAHWTVVSHYGSTEAPLVVHGDGAPQVDFMCVNAGGSSAELVADGWLPSADFAASFRQLACEADGAGEILWRIQRADAFVGYLANAALSAAVVEVGEDGGGDRWYRPGDVVSYDSASGLLRFVDRAGDARQVGTRAVSARRLQAALLDAFVAAHRRFPPKFVVIPSVRASDAVPFLVVVEEHVRGAHATFSVDMAAAVKKSGVLVDDVLELLRSTICVAQIPAIAGVGKDDLVSLRALLARRE